jgi:hypothetical protein
VERVIAQYETDQLRNGQIAIKARFGQRSNRPIVLQHRDEETVHNVVTMLEMLMTGKVLVRYDDGTFEVVEPEPQEE